MVYRGEYDEEFGGLMPSRSHPRLTVKISSSEVSSRTPPPAEFSLPLLCWRFRSDFPLTGTLNTLSRAAGCLPNTIRHLYTRDHRFSGKLAGSVRENMVTLAARDAPRVITVRSNESEGLLPANSIREVVFHSTPHWGSSSAACKTAVQVRVRPGFRVSIR